MNICWGNIYRGFGALFCLPWSEMEAIQRQGYEDTVHFLIKEGICVHRYYLYSVNFVTLANK